MIRISTCCIVPVVIQVKQNIEINEDASSHKSMAVVPVPILTPACTLPGIEPWHYGTIPPKRTSSNIRSTRTHFCETIVFVGLTRLTSQRYWQRRGNYGTRAWISRVLSFPARLPATVLQSRANEATSSRRY